MPTVAAMLITRGRQQWAAQALACFQAQTYEPKALLVLDDADDPSFPTPPDYPNVRYGLLEKRLTIPEKRNMAAEMIKSEVICHWDSDDWNAPTRIADQVKLLSESGKAVCGFHSLLFFDEASRRAFKYIGDHKYAVGTSLMYLTSWQQDHPFRPGSGTPTWGEDNEFVDDARKRDQLIAVDGGALAVARIHNENTCIKKIGGETVSYRPVPLEALPQGFIR